MVCEDLEVLPSFLPSSETGLLLHLLMWVQNHTPSDALICNDSFEVRPTADTNSSKTRMLLSRAYSTSCPPCAGLSTC